MTKDYASCCEPYTLAMKTILNEMVLHTSVSKIIMVYKNCFDQKFLAKYFNL